MCRLVRWTNERILTPCKKSENRGAGGGGGGGGVGRKKYNFYSRGDELTLRSAVRGEAKTLDSRADH